MKDSKIDSVLEAHINDYNLEDEYLKAVILLGKTFIKTLAEIYDEGYLEKVYEAKNIVQAYLDKVGETKSLIQNYLQGSSAKIVDLFIYRSYLLKSFKNRPNLDVDDRKMYINVYCFCAKCNECADNPEEEVTKKTIMWYENYKQKSSDDEITWAYEIASLAIKDQVYETWFNKSYQDGKQKRL